MNGFVELVCRRAAKAVIVVVNKIRDKQESSYISNQLEVFHEIPYDEELKRKSMDNEKLGEDSVFYKYVVDLAGKIRGDFS